MCSHRWQPLQKLERFHEAATEVAPCVARYHRRFRRSEGGLCVSLSGPLAGLASVKSRDNLSALGKAAGSTGSRLDAMGQPVGEVAGEADAAAGEAGGGSGVGGGREGSGGSGAGGASAEVEEERAAQAQLLKEALRLQAQEASQTAGQPRQLTPTRVVTRVETHVTSVTPMTHVAYGTHVACA